MNASDQFFSGGQSLNYGPLEDKRWMNRPRGGLIVSEPVESQQIDYATKQPKFWDAPQNTQPMMQLSFDVICDGSGPAQQNGWQTSERVDQADTGKRTVFVKGKDKIEAIKAQLSQHQRPGLRVGDYYYEVWTGTRQGKIGGPARTWAVVLFPGAGAEQASFFGNQPQPPQAPAAFQPPAQQSPPAAPSAQTWGQTQGAPVPSAQGNAYGFGHNPPASPGGQAYAAAQQPAQGFASPPPSFQPPAQQYSPGPQADYAAPVQGQYQQPGNPVGAAPQPPAPAQQFGPPVPPVDNPWGAAQQPAQNPYGG